MANELETIPGFKVVAPEDAIEDVMGEDAKKAEPVEEDSNLDAIKDPQAL